MKNKGRSPSFATASCAIAAVVACGVLSCGGSSGPDTSSGSPPDCPGIPGRFGGPQPEGAVICEQNGPGVLVCKDGQWQSAGFSCADSTTTDSAGVVHSCECSTDYPLWSGRCWYENKTCLYVYAGGGDPCQGKPAGAVCGGGNWLYACDGQGGVTANVYCAYGCADDHCLGDDPCVNAMSDGKMCGVRLTTPTSSNPLFQNVSALPDTLYDCRGRYTESSTACPNGCLLAQNGGDDSCK